MPDAPFFVNDKRHGRCLYLGGDGSYEECQALLRELQDVFGARYSEHLENGPCPGADKEEGYWNVELFGQDFFVMRSRGDGTCLWGPASPADIHGFLRVADYFGAHERMSLLSRIVRRLHLTGRCT